MNGVKFFGKGMVAMACALSLTFFACSSRDKSPAKVVNNPDNTKPDPGKVVNALDSLVDANKGKGKGVVTGFLTGEGSSVAQGLLKQAVNAAGERRLLTKSETPLSGATVLIFNALKPTTFADTSVTTDAQGNYTAILDEGTYFAFAVHLDLQTFQLVTTQIPNIQLVKDTWVKMDTATAIEDVTAPTVTGVYDAGAPNSDGVFLVGAVPATNAKINIIFSEPMNRESAKGVVLGSVDTSSASSSVALADTVSGVTMTWSGDNKQLTLNIPSMEVGKQYGIIMPVSLKDLAKNPLSKQFTATFVTVKASEISAVAFAATATFPADGESVKPIQNPSVSFNRPADPFSILKGASIDPKISGYWEVTGARAAFIHKDAFTVGTKYTVTIPETVTDIGGAALGKAFAFSFTVKDFEGAAKDNTGEGKDVALTVETAFDAYLAGDIGRFSTYFHPNFRLYEEGKIKGRTEFLDDRRKDVADRQAQSAGFSGPVFADDSAACKDGGGRWKVLAKDDPSLYLWVDAYVGPGQSPRAFDKDGKEISRADLTWDPAGPRFTYQSHVYGFAPDFSKFNGAVNMDGAKDDGRFMADMLRQTSSVALEPIKLEEKTEFNVDPNVFITGDTAKLAVKMIDYSKYNRVNFRDGNMACHGSLTDTSYQILKFILVKDGSGHWLVLNIVSDDQKRNKDNINQSVSANDFQIQQAQPIRLVEPINGIDKAGDDKGQVTFKFTGVKSDSVGGYIVGLAEDGKFCIGRPPYGALYFVKASKHDGTQESFTINSAAGASSDNATGIYRRPQDLRLPSWERTMFEFALNKLVNQDSGFAGVYNWKCIAVKDTSAAQFINGQGFTPSRFLGESDFGGTNGYFVVKSYPSGDFFNRAPINPPPMGGMNGPVAFGDMDQDGVPDQMEMKYKTDMRDRNSYPDFRVDTDGDKLADFLEALLDPDGKDSLVVKAATAEQLAAEIARLKTLGIEWIDSDGDGFPDDVEQMLGFNPRDPMNNPGTRPRAQAPIGVFTGVIMMGGGNKNSVSFKLYSDSAKHLMVAYKAVVGNDTLVDTARAGFTELMGEVLVAVTMSKTGPDAGRAMLLRGHYDAIQAVIMGSVEMIPAVGKDVSNFPGGPWVGQFAASGRGEDVSRFLPGNGPNPGPATGPVYNNPVPAGMMYRLPPAGVSEGAKLVFQDNGAVVLINEFGDTLAVLENVMFRGQPDGSWQFNADKDVNGTVHKHFHVDGRAAIGGDNWIVDGGFFTDIDSSGMHKGIPGQYCAQLAKTSVGHGPNGLGITGGFKGWIAQDKFGTGFTGSPTNNLPPCPTPTATNCQQQNTDPTGTCQPGMPCSQPPPPTNTFGRPLMGGKDSFRNQMGGVKDFFVSMNGGIFHVTLDSNHVADALSPWCGQVVVHPDIIPLKDGAGDVEKRGYAKDSSMLAAIGNGNVVIVLEDQFHPGVPARMDKAFDSQGNIVTMVVMVEMRPVPFDYGKLNQCGPTTNPNSNPGPTTQGTPPPFYQGSLDVLKQALVTSANQVGLVKDSSGNIAGKIAVDAGTLNFDPNAKVVSVSGNGQRYLFLGLPQDVMQLMIKDGVPLVVYPPQNNNNPPPPTDTTHQSTPTVVFYKGTLDAFNTVLNGAGSQGIEVFTDGKIGGRVMLNAASAHFESAKSMYMINENVAGGKIFAILGDAADPTKPYIKDGVPAVLSVGTQGTVQNNPPPTDNPPPQDGTPPPLYSGSLDNVTAALASHNNKVVVVGPNTTPSGALVNPQTLKTDGNMTVIADANNGANVYVFLGDRADATKLFVDAGGNLVVSLRPPTTAGP